MTTPNSEGPNPIQDLVDALDGALTHLDAASRAALLELGRPDAAVTFEDELAASATRSVVNRLDDVFALLKDRTGGTVAGALGRSLVEQSCTKRWLTQPGTEVGRTRLIALAQERYRLRELVTKRGLSVPNLMRWLRPLHSELDVPPARSSTPSEGLPDLQQDLPKKAGAFIAANTGVPAAVSDLLAMCGHANFAAAMCTVAVPPHSMGFEATPPYAALFAQAAATSAWSAINPTGETAAIETVASIARGIHRLPDTYADTTNISVDLTGRTAPTYDEEVEYRPPSPYHDDLLGQVLERSHAVFELLVQAPNPYKSTASNSINITGALPYLTALSTAEVAIRAASEEMSGVAAATAGRMLIEEAARMNWQGSVDDDEGLWERYVAVADGATQGRSLLRERLIVAGTSKAALAALFDSLPDAGTLAIDTRRTPASMKAPRQARPFAQLLGLGEHFTEAGWLDLAFSLLSQVVHGTPLGDMHLLGRARPDGLLVLSHEMTALAVDCACLGAATILPTFAAVLDLTLKLDGHREWSEELAHAAVAVHNVSQRLHFLD